MKSELVRTSDETTKLFRAAGLQGEISLSIPENASLESVETTLHLAISGYKRLHEAAEKLKPIIGRILLTVESRKLFKPGYKNFTAFVMEKVVKEMGFPRTNAFEALRIAKAFPSLSAAEYTNIGGTRLLLAARITNEQDDEYRKILTRASRMTVEEFREQVKLMDAAATGEAPADTRKVIQIRVPEPVYVRWQTALRNAGDVPAAEVFDQMLIRWEAPVVAHSRKPAMRSRAAGRAA